MKTKHQKEIAKLRRAHNRQLRDVEFARANLSHALTVERAEHYALKQRFQGMQTDLETAARTVRELRDMERELRARLRVSRAMEEALFDIAAQATKLGDNAIRRAAELGAPRNGERVVTGVDMQASPSERGP